jgi:NifU-like protein involved in Fe-S cluster formation
VSEGSPYSAEVRRLFAAPPRCGTLPPGPGTPCRGEAQALERGAWVRLEVRLEDGIVADARFRAWGCPHLIAACALVTGRLVGQPATAAFRLDPAALARELEVPAAKLGRLLVLEDALSGLAAGMGRAQ